MERTLTNGSNAVVLIDRYITRKLVIKTILKIEELINTEYPEGGLFDENIYLLIDSEGGDVEPTFFLYDYLRDLSIDKNINVVTNALGECKSSALLIFIAGNERVCGLNTTFMIHDSVLSSEEKNVKEILSQTTYVNNQSTRYYEAIATASKLEPEQIERKVTNKGEWYFDGRKAFNLGIATVLIGEEKEDEQDQSTETQCACSEQALDSNSHNNSS